MPSDSRIPAHALAVSLRPHPVFGKRVPVRKVANRTLLLLVMLFVLSLPAVPPPEGAIRPLWAEAADLQALRSYAAAVEVYEQIATLSPLDPEPLLSMGTVYAAQHRWPLAEDAYNRALTRDANNTRALAGLAAARWEQGDRRRAVELWEAVVPPCLGDANQAERHNSPPGARLRLALAYLDTDRLADAERMFQSELACGDNPTARLYLAMLQALDDPVAAKRELRAIAGNVIPPIAAGRDYLWAAIDQAEESDSPAQAAESLALAFMELNEWQLAHVALERALALDPNNPEVMAFFGHAQAQLGRPAFKHLVAATESRPNWPLGHYLLGLYYQKQGLYGLAAEELLATLRLDPGNAQAYVDLAAAYVGQGQYLAAEEALANAVAAAPDDPGFRLTQVRFYADHAFNITDRGVGAARAAADMAPDDPRFRDLLGWIYFLAGDPNLARLHLESAIRQDPHLTSAYYHLGMLHKLLGEEEAARFAFLRVVDLDTEGFYRSRAQATLREMGQ